ncbi:MAG: hypothetical protein AAF927_01645 [Bacteroidota bacterium]
MSRIYIHIAIVLGFLITTAILISVVKNLFSKADDKARLDRQMALENAGMRLSFPVHQYGDWADQIQDAIARGSAVQDDPAKAVAVLKRPVNELDILELISAYGVRKDIVFGFNDGDKNLPQLIADELDTEETEEVNANYRQKGIQYQF